MATRNLDDGVEFKPDVQHFDRTPSIEGDVLKNDAIHAEYVPGTKEEKKLVRKIDIRLLPMLWVMYIFNYIDRTNIGNAKSGGMEVDLQLSSTDYSLILSLFFVTYLLFEVPSNMILTRTRPSIFLPSIMLAWGAMSIGAKGVNSTGGMIAFRLALGVIEAGFFPGVMLLMSCWYKPAELSKRVALFYTASLVAGAFGGILAGVIIEGMEGLGNTRGWKWLFIVEGLGTVVAAIIAYFVLPDFPSNTKWLTPEEVSLAQIRLAVREDLDTGESSHKADFMAAIKDPKTYAFMLVYNLLNSVSTISYFFPTLMGSLGYTGRMVQFMTVPIYVVAYFVAITVGWSADRFGTKAYHLLAACCCGMISFIICVSVPASMPTVRYAFIVFGGSAIWSCIPLFLSWTITMFEPRGKRAVCIALINGVGNTASIYGSFFWPSNTAPQYTMGFGITSALMGLAAVVIFLLKWKYGDKGVQRRE